MAKKLFAMEDGNEDESTGDKNKLLIDKVLERAAQPKSPMSLTADVLKQRQDLKEEIGDKLKTDDEDNNQSDGDDNGSGDDSSGSGSDGASDSSSSDSDDSSGGSSDSGEDVSGSGDKAGQDSKDDSSDGGSSKAKEKEGDSTAAADDKESLKNLIGSGHDEGGGDKGGNEKKDEPAQESYALRPNNIFKPIADRYQGYCVSLEAYGLEDNAKSVNEQPVVYVKESVIKSLNSLVALAKQYIENNVGFIQAKANGVKDVNERITVFKQFVEAEKYSFTNTMVKDQEVLTALSVKGKSDIRKTIAILLAYVEASNASARLLSTNSFDTLPDSYKNSGFTVEGEDMVYKAELPGFNTVKVHLDEYVNYLKVNIENFHYYVVKTFKTEDLYGLDAITVNEDKDLAFIVESLDKLLIGISLATDNLNDVNTHFTQFVDAIKVIIYDVENDKQKDLGSLDIDTKAKDFIKFKLIIEMLYININLMINYMTTVMSVINQCVELKD